jgi:hypothetical protein
MRLWTVSVLAGLLLASACGIGFAIPSLGGPTGVVTTPDARVASGGTVDAAFSYQAMRTTQLVQSAAFYGATPIISEQTHSGTAWSLQAATGIADKAEVWADYHSVRDMEDSHIWGLGGKLQLAKEPERPVSLACGLGYRDWTDHLSQVIAPLGGAVPAGTLVSSFEGLKVWNAYLVVSKDLTMEKKDRPRWGVGGDNHLLANAGLIYLKVDTQVAGNDSLFRPFVSAEIIGGDTEVAAEYRFKGSSIDEQGVFSAVLRQKLSPDITLEVGTTNSDPVGIGLGDQNIFWRLGYQIPSKVVY